MHELITNEPIRYFLARRNMFESFIVGLVEKGDFLDWKVGQSKTRFKYILPVHLFN